MPCFRRPGHIFSTYVNKVAHVKGYLNNIMHLCTDEGQGLDSSAADATRRVAQICIIA